MRLPFTRDAKALTAEPAVIQALQSGSWSPYPLLGGGQRQRIMDQYNIAKSANYSWLYANSPSLRMVIDCIVRNIGQLEMRLYEEVSESERKPRPDHPAAMSLRYPSELVSADKFVREMVKDFLIYDDATAIMTEAPGRKVTFNWVPFSQMEVRGSGLFQADEYRYWRGDGTWVDFPAGQVFHWHGENPSDPRIGLSHLDTLRDVVAEEVALRQATIELGNAGLTEAIWAYRPLEAPVMQRPTVEGLEEDLTNKVRRRNRRVIVTQEGTELRSFGVNPKDAQMLELRHKILVEVSAEYGMPFGMLAETPSDEAREIFLNDCLAPLCENFTRFTNHRVLVRVYNWTDGCFSFSLDEKRMGNEWIKTLISAAGAPIFMRDESRARLGMPPLPDGVGKVPVVPTNVQKDDGTSTGKPSVDVMPIQNPNGPPQDGSHRTMLDLADAVRKNTDAVKAIEEQVARKKTHDDPPVEPAADASAEDVLLRTFTRYERSYATHGRIDKGRFTRELRQDLAEACPDIAAEPLAAMVDGIFKALTTALEEQPAEVVFGTAQRNAGTVADQLQRMSGSPTTMDAKQLRELGVPDPIVWERAGFSSEEIDRMRSLAYTDDLLEATRDASDPPGT